MITAAHALQDNTATQVEQARAPPAKWADFLPYQVASLALHVIRGRILMPTFCQSGARSAVEDPIKINMGQRHAWVVPQALLVPMNVCRLAKNAQQASFETLHMLRIVLYVKKESIRMRQGVLFALCVNRVPILQALALPPAFCALWAWQRTTMELWAANPVMSATMLTHWGLQVARNVQLVHIKMFMALRCALTAFPGSLRWRALVNVLRARRKPPIPGLVWASAFDVRTKPMPLNLAIYVFVLQACLPQLATLI